MKRAAATAAAGAACAAVLAALAFHVATGGNQAPGTALVRALVWAGGLLGAAALLAAALAWRAGINSRLEQANRALEREIKERSFALDMRYKQVYCLYAISRLQGTPGMALPELLDKIADLIPPAWRFPEVTCARITLGEASFETDGFRETQWKLVSGITCGGRPAGTVEVYYLEPRPASHEGPFLREERTLLNVIAEHVGEIVDRKRADEYLAQARQRELDIGARIQEKLLLGPPPEDMNGVRAAALTIPSHGIGGDFHEFLRRSEGVLDIIVGDVMGKGVPAALLGAGAKGNFLRSVSRPVSTAGGLPEPAAVVQDVHRRMVGELMELESFLTLTYARLDMERGVLELVDCGHPKTIHVSGGTGEVKLIEGSNVPMGLIEDARYEQTTVALGPGDVLFFYSDGVTEAGGGSGGVFGEERLARGVRARSHLFPEEIIHEVLEDVLRHAGGRAVSDDITCVAVRIKDPADPGAQAAVTADLTSEPEELGRLRDLVKSFCTDAGLSERDEAVWKIELAANEATANIIKHAYRGKAGHPIRVEAEAYPERFIIRLRHSGGHFTPDYTAEPCMDKPGEGGLGLYLMDKCVDKVIYCRYENGRNAVWLIKKRGTSKPRN